MIARQLHEAPVQSEHLPSPVRPLGGCWPFVGGVVCQLIDISVLGELGLNLDQLGIRAVLMKKIAVRSLLDQLTPLEDQDSVGVAKGREAVGDRDHGSATRQSFERLLNRAFRLGVDAAGRLVQDQNGRVVEDCPRQGETLFFTPERPAPCSPSTVS